ncbi:DnaJ domain-containing protein [Saccharothrix sp. NPDC042600]|uniref:J domain-containing protein n=1 Tax=Saccharothrix TaxID=2071 RepID=UPI0033F4F2B7|nr:hypothetical protein GCM10017745_58550 [Saccharothrix mutabilis subsp. capreolus]
MTGPSLRDLDGHNPYALLGVEPKATRAQIVAAHRQQVQLVHPDRPGGSEYETKLLHIAKDVLLDPRRRAEFDATLKAGTSASGTGTSAEDRDDPEDRHDEPARADSLWESEEVVVGVEPPNRDDRHRDDGHWDDEHWDDRAESAWDDATWDNTPPRHDPAWDTTPPRHDPPYWTPQPPPPPRWQPPPQWQPPQWQPRRRAVSALPIVALVLATVCSCAPLGVILGFASLRNPKGTADRVIARIAISIGTISTLLFLYYLSKSTTNP